MSQNTLQQLIEQAVQYHKAGRLHEAEQIYRQLLANDPDDPNALHMLGVIAHHHNNHVLAIDLIRRAVALRPDWAEAWSNMGMALKDIRLFDEAVDAFKRAIEIKPSLAELHHNLGNVLKELNRNDEAIASHRKAISLKGDFAMAYNDLGNALLDKGQYDDALAAFRQAITLKPDYPGPYNNVAKVLSDTGQHEEATANYRQSLSRDPDRVETHSNLILHLHYCPGCDAQEIAREEQTWNLQHAMPLAKYIRLHNNDRNPQRRLRIGYVSPDFRDHVVGRYILPLLAHHDRSQFEIFGYAQVAIPDAMTQRLRSYTDGWRDIVGQSDAQVVELIRQDQIDILVDLALHTAHNRLTLFARKPAPVQVTYAGYPGSTGLKTIDYRLSDPYLDPPGMDESIYSEQTLRLPDTFWCYDPLIDKEVPVNPLPALNEKHVTFGCLNYFGKINTEVLKLWARVLRAVEQSRLMMLSPEGNHRKKVLDMLAEEGIDPNRVGFTAFQPRLVYMQMYHQIDIGLDSFPYNGHTSSIDSYWMGVPVVTLVGQTVVGRAGLSQLTNLDLTELIAHSPDQFVQIAVELADDLHRLAHMRSTLRQRLQQSPLMNARQYALGIETAYRRIWRDWCDRK